ARWRRVPLGCDPRRCALHDPRPAPDGARTRRGDPAAAGCAARAAVGAAVHPGRAVHPRGDVPARRHRGNSRQPAAPTTRWDGGRRPRGDGRAGRARTGVAMTDATAGPHTIGRWLHDSAIARPTRIAIDDRGVRTGYRALADRVDALAER